MIKKTVMIMACVIAGFATDSVAVLAIFKDEANYLHEWITFHREMGVSRFYLYDHFSSDNYKEVLDPFIKDDLVVLLDAKKFDLEQKCAPRNIQSRAYKEGINLAKSDGFDWLAPIDIDEFIFPMREKTIPQTLRKHFNNVSFVYMNWKCFGTSSKKLKTGQNILPNLTRCSLENHPRNWVGKGMIRLEHVHANSLWNPHFCKVDGRVCYGDGQLVGNGRPFDIANNLITDAKHHSGLLRINHYFTRDDRFWYKTKLKRIIERGEGKNLDMYLQQGKDFNIMKDTKIIHFLKKKHPSLWQELNNAE